MCYLINLQHAYLNKQKMTPMQFMFSSTCRSAYGGLIWTCNRNNYQTRKHIYTSDIIPKTLLH